VGNEISVGNVFVDTNKSISNIPEAGPFGNGSHNISADTSYGIAWNDSPKETLNLVHSSGFSEAWFLPTQQNADPNFDQESAIPRMNQTPVGVKPQ